MLITVYLSFLSFFHYFYFVMSKMRYGELPFLFYNYSIEKNFETTKMELQNSIESCTQVLKAGSAVYNVSKAAAEHIWEVRFSFFVFFFFCIFPFLYFSFFYIFHFMFLTFLFSF